MTDYFEPEQEHCPECGYPTMGVKSYSEGDGDFIVANKCDKCGYVEEIISETWIAEDGTEHADYDAMNEHNYLLSLDNDHE